MVDPTFGRQSLSNIQQNRLVGPAAFFGAKKRATGSFLGATKASAALSRRLDCDGPLYYVRRYASILAYEQNLGFSVHNLGR
jgi:hypothetical protein